MELKIYMLYDPALQTELGMHTPSDRTSQVLLGYHLDKLLHKGIHEQGLWLPYLHHKTGDSQAHR